MSTGLSTWRRHWQPSRHPAGKHKVKTALSAAIKSHSDTEIQRILQSANHFTQLQCIDEEISDIQRIIAQPVNEPA